MKSFQQTIADALDAVRLNTVASLDEATRLVESVERQASVDLFYKLNLALIEVDNLKEDVRKGTSASAAASVRKIERILVPFTKPDAKVPDAKRFGRVLHQILEIVEEGGPSSYDVLQGLLDDAVEYATSGEVRGDVLHAAARATLVMSIAGHARRAEPFYVDSRAQLLSILHKLLRTTKTASEAQMDHPETLPEWQHYILSLSGPDLLSKARAANQVLFVRALEEDGLPPQDVAKVLHMFAARLVEDGQELPGRYEGAYVDYGALLYPTPLPG